MEQNINVNQINKAIQELNLVVQQNSSTAEELSTGAEELVGQSLSLQDAISFFKLDGAEVTTKIADMETHIKELVNTIQALKGEEEIKNSDSLSVKVEKIIKNDTGVEINMANEDSNFQKY